MGDARSEVFSLSLWCAEFQSSCPLTRRLRQVIKAFHFEPSWPELHSEKSLFLPSRQALSKVPLPFMMMSFSCCLHSFSQYVNLCEYCSWSFTLSKLCAKLYRNSEPWFIAARHNFLHPKIPLPAKEFQINSPLDQALPSKETYTLYPPPSKNARVQQNRYCFSHLALLEARGSTLNYSWENLPDLQCEILRMPSLTSKFELRRARLQRCIMKAKILRCASLILVLRSSTLEEPQT
jgi:hypothetical protein